MKGTIASDYQGGVLVFSINGKEMYRHTLKTSVPDKKLADALARDAKGKGGWMDLAKQMLRKRGLAPESIGSQIRFIPPWQGAR